MSDIKFYEKVSEVVKSKSEYRDVYDKLRKKQRILRGQFM